MFENLCAALKHRKDRNDKAFDVHSRLAISGNFIPSQTEEAN
jgi:hypothetical protein